MASGQLTKLLTFIGLTVVCIGCAVWWVHSQRGIRALGRGLVSAPNHGSQDKAESGPGLAVRTGAHGHPEHGGDGLLTGGRRMRATYTGRKAIRREGQEHFAEVTVRAEPCPPPSRVTLSAEALEYLRATFGPDFEYHRHNVQAAVEAQIATANVAGQMPHAGAASFHAVVTRVHVSGNAGQQVSGFLLTIAAMDAVGEYLDDWEKTETERGRR